MVYNIPLGLNNGLLMALMRLHRALLPHRPGREEREGAMDGERGGEGRGDGWRERERSWGWEKVNRDMGRTRHGRRIGGMEEGGMGKGRNETNAKGEKEMARKVKKL